MKGRTESRRDGWVGRKQCYSPIQTHEWQKERTQQDFSSNRMCMKKLIQARVMWHTNRSSRHETDTVAFTRGGGSESFVKLSLIFLTPQVHILLCWWLSHFLRDCGQEQWSKCLCGHRLRQERLLFPETILSKALISLFPTPTPHKVHILPFNLRRPSRRDIIQSKGHCFNLNQFNTKFQKRSGLLDFLGLS